jgi:hypothetical protein
MQVIQEDFNERPDKSDYNPLGLPERTINEIRLYEFGPVTFPAYANTTPGLRSLTDDRFVCDWIERNPSRARDMSGHCDRSHVPRAATTAGRTLRDGRRRPPGHLDTGAPRSGPFGPHPVKWAPTFGARRLRRHSAMPEIKTVEELRDEKSQLVTRNQEIDTTHAGQWLDPQSDQGQEFDRNDERIGEIDKTIRQLEARQKRLEDYGKARNGDSDDETGDFEFVGSERGAGSTLPAAVSLAARTSTTCRRSGRA